MFVALSLPLAVCACALSRTETTRILHAIAATLGAIFLVYTRTRGAWLGVGFGIAALVVALKVTEDYAGGWRVWSDRLAARKRPIDEHVGSNSTLCGSVCPHHAALASTVGPELHRGHQRGPTIRAIRL